VDHSPSPHRVTCLQLPKIHFRLAFAGENVQKRIDSLEDRLRPTRCRRRVGKAELLVDQIEDSDQAILWKNQGGGVSQEYRTSQMNRLAEEALDRVNMLKLLHRSDVEVDRPIEVAEGATVPVATESHLQDQRQVLVWRKWSPASRRRQRPASALRNERCPTAGILRASSR
jgi:hypothetical protein